MRNKQTLFSGPCDWRGQRSCFALKGHREGLESELTSVQMSAKGVRMTSLTIEQPLSGHCKGSRSLFLYLIRARHLAGLKSATSHLRRSQSNKSGIRISGAKVPHFKCETTYLRLRSNFPSVNVIS